MFGNRGASQFISSLRHLLPLSAAWPRLPIQPVMSLRSVGDILPPVRTRNKKAQKGRVSVPTGGSIKGCTLINGDFGLFIKEGIRINTAQLEAARRAIRRMLRPIKENDVIVRVYPDIPVTKKAREVPMGGGKGNVDHFICRVKMNRILFEIKGKDLREEFARRVLWQGAQKLPGQYGVICRTDERHIEFMRRNMEWPGGIIPPFVPLEFLPKGYDIDKEA